MPNDYMTVVFRSVNLESYVTYLQHHIRSLLLTYTHNLYTVSWDTCRKTRLWK